MHVPLRQLPGGANNGTLHERIGDAGEADGEGGGVESTDDSDTTPDVEGVNQGNDEERNDEEDQTKVDSEKGFGAVTVQDDEGDSDEADEHVNDGEDAVNACVRVKIGEVINGCDESVPREKVTESQEEIHYVRQIPFVFRSIALPAVRTGRKEKRRLREHHLVPFRSGLPMLNHRFEHCQREK